MSQTTHIGYGPFQLCDFQTGDIFARFDGSLAKVVDPQPPGRPNHILIWNNYETSNAERIWLYRTALAYAVSPEEARKIVQRTKRKPMAIDAYEYIPTALAKQIPSLYATGPIADPTVWVKLFTPDSNWTWYLTEYDPAERQCFGFVVGQESELGYFNLAEMEGLRGPLGLRIERDLHFKPQPLSQVREKHP